MEAAEIVQSSMYSKMSDVWSFSEENQVNPIAVRCRQQPNVLNTLQDVTLAMFLHAHVLCGVFQQTFCRSDIVNRAPGAFE